MRRARYNVRNATHAARDSGDGVGVGGHLDELLAIRGTGGAERERERERERESYSLKMKRIELRNRKKI